MVNLKSCNDILTLINGVRKDLDTIRQNLNEMQNMMYRCSTDEEFEEWLSMHDPEHGSNYVMIFGG